MIADKKDRAVMGTRHEENSGEPQRDGVDTIVDKITTLPRFQKHNKTNKTRPPILPYLLKGFKNPRNTMGQSAS